MSLACLTCQTLLRTESLDMETEQLDPNLNRLRSNGPDRNWSGCLLPPPYENKRKALHKRGGSVASANIEEQAVADASGEPRLQRSRGMRRDWSFEDLKKSAVVIRM
ncbi:uncharacterized protein LOC131249830 [Magnolia sinica]|uniref:uncharacterized protein LOC131249830 n=1 Tax=Magnolia sinica TaxID=86752 RepID=UPI002658D0E0|nr:uncharacterized protein LOC131249830 [Magnolia sinica]